MKNILTLAIALLLCACNADNTLPTPPEQGGEGPAVNITIMRGNGGGTKATRLGDPGLGERMPEPKHVYLFVWKKQNADTYGFLFKHIKDLASTAWEVEDEGDPLVERYRMKQSVPLGALAPAVDDAGFSNREDIGRIYAIASNSDIPADVLKTWVNGLCSGLFSYDGVEDEYVKNGIVSTSYPIADLEAKIRALELDCKKWNSQELRDLYSTPANSDYRWDTKWGVENGRIIYLRPAVEGKTEAAGEVRLYHAAAKIDFKWEVPGGLQDQLAVKKITTKGLPTTCKIFIPTENPTTPTNSYIIGGLATDADVANGINHGTAQAINPGNKWIGREYFYALQPSSSKIEYTVEFESIDGTTTKAPVNASFAPAVPSSVFTGWYRINATVTK